MPDFLPALESQRADILRKIGALGGLRAGSITTTGGRCGNSGCHCRKDGGPGHGPFFSSHPQGPRQNHHRDLRYPVALRKAQEEVAEFHRFRELSQKLLDVKEKICKQRPVEDTCRRRKKTAETVRQEIDREISALLRMVSQALRNTGMLELEAVEMAMRTAVRQAGAAALRQLLR